ncbi:hypothetical protein BDF22DRAFT_740918 [Syncephalis plumigaleata]|nr:hypothetical protein BDF22DRAFT_740918 [Syncephalis plumigaleata]
MATASFSPSDRPSPTFSGGSPGNATPSAYHARFQSSDDMRQPSTARPSASTLSTPSSMLLQHPLPEQPPAPPSRIMPPALPHRSLSTGRIVPAYPPRPGSESVPPQSMPGSSMQSIMANSNENQVPAYPGSSQTSSSGLNLAEYLRLSNGIRALEYAEVELIPCKEELAVLREQLNKATEEASSMEHKRQVHLRIHAIALSNTTQQ